MAPTHHARAKSRDWECQWFRTTLRARLNSSETHGSATDCTVKLFIIKNLFLAGYLRCRLWNCANIPLICLFSTTTFWESKPADAPVLRNVLHLHRPPQHPSSSVFHVYPAFVITRLLLAFFSGKSWPISVVLAQLNHNSCQWHWKGNYKCIFFFQNSRNELLVSFTSFKSNQSYLFLCQVENWIQFKLCHTIQSRLEIICVPILLFVVCGECLLGYYSVSHISQFWTR